MDKITPEAFRASLLESPEGTEPQEVVAGLFRAGGVEPTPELVSGWMSQNLGDVYQPDTIDQIQSFFGQAPGMLTRGVTNTQAILTQGANYLLAPDAETRAKNAAGIEQVRQDVEDFTKTDMTPDFAMSRARSLPGQVIWGLGEFLAENLPETALAVGTGGTSMLAKGGARLALRSALKSGVTSRSKRKAIREIGRIMGREADEGLKIGAMVGVKSPVAQQSIVDFIKADAEGSSQKAHAALETFASHMGSELAINAVAGMGAGLVFKGLGSAGKRAWGAGKVWAAGKRTKTATEALDAQRAQDKAVVEATVAERVAKGEDPATVRAEVDQLHAEIDARADAEQLQVLYHNLVQGDNNLVDLIEQTYWADAQASLDLHKYKSMLDELEARVMSRVEQMGKIERTPEERLMVQQIKALKERLTDATDGLAGAVGRFLQDPAAHKTPSDKLMAKLLMMGQHNWDAGAPDAPAIPIEMIYKLNTENVLNYHSRGNDGVEQGIHEFMGKLNPEDFSARMNLKRERLEVGKWKYSGEGEFDYVVTKINQRKFAIAPEGDPLGVIQYVGSLKAAEDIIKKVEVENGLGDSYYQALVEAFFDPLAAANKNGVMDELLQYLDESYGFLKDMDSPRVEALLRDPEKFMSEFKRAMDEVFGPGGHYGPEEMYNIMSMKPKVEDWHRPASSVNPGQVGYNHIAKATGMGDTPAWMKMTIGAKRMPKMDLDGFMQIGWPKEFALKVVGKVRANAIDNWKAAKSSGDSAKQQMWKELHDQTFIAEGLMKSADNPEVPLFTGMNKSLKKSTLGVLEEQQNMIWSGAKGNVATTFHEFGHWAWKMMPQAVREDFARFVKAVANDPGKKQVLEQLTQTAYREDNIYEIFANTFMKSMMMNVREGMGHMSGLDLPPSVLDYLAKGASELSEGAANALDDNSRAMMQMIGDHIFNNSQRMKYLQDPEVQQMRQAIIKTKDLDSRILAEDMDMQVRESMWENIRSHMSEEKIDVDLTEKEVADVLTKNAAEIKISQGDVEPKQLMENYLYEARKFLRHVTHDDGDYVQYLRTQVFKDKDKLVDDLINDLETNRSFNEFAEILLVSGKENAAARSKAYVELEKKFADLRSYNLYMATHNPTIYNNMSVESLDGVINQTVRWLRGGFDSKSNWQDGVLPPYFRKLKEDMRDISKFHNVLLQDHHLGRENIYYYAVSRPLRNILEQTQTHQAQILTGDGLGSAFDEALGKIANGKTMEQFIQMPEGRLQKAVSDMLWTGNNLANKLSVISRSGEKGAIGKYMKKHGLERDKHGILTRASIAKLMKQEGREFSEEAYDYYAGTTLTMSWIAKDMQKFLGTRRMISEEGGKLVDAARNKMDTLLGMVPQTRRGKFYLHVVKDVVDDDGNIVYNADKTKKTEVIYNVASDSKKELLALEAEFKAKGSVQGVELGEGYTRGVQTSKKVSGEAFFGANPESTMTMVNAVIEKARKEVDLPEELDKIAEQIVIDTTKNGGFFGHLQRRQNILGYNEADLQKNLYSFVEGYARFKARSRAMRKSLHAFSKIDPKREAHVWKAANKLMKDSLGEQSEWQRPVAMARNLVLMRYLGFNVSSALLQVTQNPLLGVGRLSLEGVKRSGRKLLSAQRDVMKGMKNGYQHLDNWEQRALNEGHLSNLTFANMVDTIQAKAMYQGKKLPHLMDQAFHKSMAMMRIAEENNRKTMLLAAYREMRKKIMKEYQPQFAKAISSEKPKLLESVHRDAMDRASTIVLDTHFAYTRQNIPAPLRGQSAFAAVGRNAYLLTQFTHNFFQTMYWLAKTGKSGEKAALRNMGILLGMGGLTAMPGYETLDTHLKKSTGRDLSLRVEGVAGKYFGGIASHGMFGILPQTKGMSQRISPSAGLGWDTFQPKVLGIAEEAKKSYRAAKSGDWMRAVRYMPVMPTTMSRVASGELYQQATHGSKTTSGKVIQGSKLSPVEAFTRFIGINPMNEGMVKYYRQRTMNSYLNGRKKKYADRIRHQFFDRGVMPGGDDWREFNEIQMDMIKNNGSFRWNSPMDILEDPYVHVEP